MASPLSIFVIKSGFLKGADREQVWMSHGDAIRSIPPGFTVLASTKQCPVAAMGNSSLKMFGLQFHPEVTDTPKGMTILDNFLGIRGCRRDWNAEAFKKDVARKPSGKMRATQGFLLVSGGVDSTVAFTLLNTISGSERVWVCTSTTGSCAVENQKSY